MSRSLCPKHRFRELQPVKWLAFGPANAKAITTVEIEVRACVSGLPERRV